MAVRLEELVKGARVRGVAPSGAVTVIDAEWVGAGAVNLTYEDEQGNVDRELIYRSGEDGLEMDEGGRAWALDTDPALFVLATKVRPNLTWTISLQVSKPLSMKIICRYHGRRQVLGMHFLQVSNGVFGIWIVPQRVLNRLVSVFSCADYLRPRFYPNPYSSII